MADEAVFRFILMSESQGGGLGAGSSATPVASGSAPGASTTAAPKPTPLAGPVRHASDVDPGGVKRPALPGPVLPAASRGILGAPGVLPAIGAASVMSGVNTIANQAMEGSGAGVVATTAGFAGGAAVGAVVGGPVGAAIGAGLGAMIGDKFITLFKKIDALVEASVHRLAQFSPHIADEQARQEQKDIEQDIRSAERVGPQMAENVRLRAEVNRAERRMKESPIAIEASNTLLRIEKWVKEGLAEILGAIKEGEELRVSDIDALFGRIPDFPPPRGFHPDENPVPLGAEFHPHPPMPGLQF